MKLKFNPIYTISAALLAPFIFSSCSKHTFSTMKTNQIPTDIAKKIIDYKSVFKMIAALPADPDTGNAEADVKLDLIRERTVDWSNYHHTILPDTSSVTSFDIPADEFLNTFKPSGQYQNFRNKAMAVFTENHEGRKFSFYMVAIEELANAGEKSHLKDLDYQQIPKKFNGTIYYFSFDHYFQGGVRIQDGMLAGRINKLNKSASTHEGMQGNFTASRRHYEIYQVHQELPGSYLASYTVEPLLSNHDRDTGLPPRQPGRKIAVAIIAPTFN